MMKVEFQNWKKEVDANQIAWLGLDCHHCSTNTINHDVLDEFNILLQNIGKDASIKGLVIYSLKDLTKAVQVLVR